MHQYFCCCTKLLNTNLYFRVGGRGKRELMRVITLLKRHPKRWLLLAWATTYSRHTVQILQMWFALQVVDHQTFKYQTSPLTLIIISRRHSIKNWCETAQAAYIGHSALFVMLSCFNFCTSLLCRYVIGL